MGEFRVTWTVQVYEHDASIIASPIATGRGSTSDEARDDLKKNVRDRIGVYANIREDSVR
jgi:hypothetical protein